MQQSPGTAVDQQQQDKRQQDQGQDKGQGQGRVRAWSCSRVAQAPVGLFGLQNMIIWQSLAGSRSGKKPFSATQGM